MIIIRLHEFLMILLMHTQTEHAGSMLAPTCRILRYCLSKTNNVIPNIQNIYCGGFYLYMPVEGSSLKPSLLSGRVFSGIIY